MLMLFWKHSNRKEDFLSGYCLRMCGAWFYSIFAESCRCNLKIRICCGTVFASGNCTVCGQVKFMYEKHTVNKKFIDTDYCLDLSFMC